MKKIYFFFSQFCKSNHASIEFFPFHFVVKDMGMWAQLIRGPNNHDMWPSVENSTIVTPHALVGVPTSTHD